jgi:Predicted membrane protein (DUF2207) N-terminal domain/Predicted membrane protein (DUF2207) C-terminal domain
VLRHTFTITILLAALCRCQPAAADPSVRSGITFFRADVTVQEDATLEVREEIVVNHAASFYQYGFRRDLPISSNDRWDPRYAGEYKPDNGIRVDILEVTEDGRPVRYEQGSGYGYSQLFIGGRNVPLDSGQHRFVIRYTVDSALSLGAARDTLYWNAIGHERNAPVAEAILAIHLPAAVPRESLEMEPRVGGRGVSFPRRPETGLERVEDSSGDVVYRATNVGPRQSLSLALSWPSGYIHPPKLDSLRRDFWMLAAPGLLFLYYLIAWFGIGPEPKPGAVVARYEPPEGLSPAAVRYIAAGTTDGRSFAAVIAELAFRGCLRVEPLNGKYKLSRLMSDRAAESALAPEEKRLLGLLFEDGPVIELSPAMDQRNAAQNGRYVFHLHEELTKQLGGQYFSRHSGIIALGVLATFASVLALAMASRGRDATAAIFFTLWVLFCGLIVGLMIEFSLASAWKAALETRVGWTKLLPATAAIAIFVAAIAFLLTKLAAGVSLSFSLMLLAFLLINLGWGPRLKRKSPLGRQASDQIAGFRQFLQKVEQDQLNRLNPSELAPGDLDRFLPYAIALDLREAWGDQLSQAFLATTVFAEE